MHRFIVPGIHNADEYQFSFVALWAQGNVFTIFFQHPHANGYLHFWRQRNKVAGEVEREAADKLKSQNRRGELTGAILLLLESRKLVIPETERQKINACEDVALLERVRDRGRSR